MNKSVIIGIFGLLLIISGAIYLNKSDFGSGVAVSTPAMSSDSPIKKSGEISFPDLAKYSGCELPGDSLPAEGKYDTFAKCLTEKGVKMYGAYWCGHCQNQKKAFGDSFKYVTYIECAEPNSNKQLEVCVKENITGYPTWEFPQKAE